MTTAVPKYLYKYRPANENTLSILSSGKIWAPRFKNLNDPFDGNIVFEQSITIEEFIQFSHFFAKTKGLDDTERREWVRKFLDGSSFRPGAMDEIVSTLKRSTMRFFEKYGVVCLSEHPDSMLMWAHYCSDHKGICIEFEKVSGCSMDEENSCFKVTYSERFPSVSCFDYAIGGRGEAIKKTHFWKSSDWKYEDEWRYIEEGGDRLVDLPGRISSIIFGVNATPEFVGKVKSLTASSGVEYKHVQLADRSYKLIIR